MTSEIYDAIVVGGGGIVGLCSALSLAKLGVKTLLLEKVVNMNMQLCVVLALCTYASYLLCNSGTI